MQRSGATICILVSNRNGQLIRTYQPNMTQLISSPLVVTLVVARSSGSQSGLGYAGSRRGGEGRMPAPYSADLRGRVLGAAAAGDAFPACRGSHSVRGWPLDALSWALAGAHAGRQVAKPHAMGTARPLSQPPAAQNHRALAELAAGYHQRTRRAISPSLVR